MFSKHVQKNIKETGEKFTNTISKFLPTTLFQTYPAGKENTRASFSLLILTNPIPIAW